MQNFIYIFIIFVLIYGYSHTRYLSILPTYPQLYPDSYLESKEVYKMALNRKKEDEELFYNTDLDCVDEFKKLLPEVNKKELNNLSVSHHWIILGLKSFYNRPRPIQVNRNIGNIMLHSITGITPAYPAGHTYQCFLLAKHYSKEFPERREKLYDLAERIGLARCKAGIHYPSDHEFSKRLAEILG